MGVVATRYVALTKTSGKVDLLDGLTLGPGVFDAKLDIQGFSVYLAADPNLTYPPIEGAASQAPYVSLGQGSYQFTVTGADSLWIWTTNSQTVDTASLLITARL